MSSWDEGYSLSLPRSSISFLLCSFLFLLLTFLIIFFSPDLCLYFKFDVFFMNENDEEPVTDVEVETGKEEDGKMRIFYSHNVPGTSPHLSFSLLACVIVCFH